MDTATEGSYTFAMRPIVVISFLLATALSVSAQQASQPVPAAAAPNLNWERVEAITPGQRMYVYATNNFTCNFLKADASSLTCTRGLAGKPLTFTEAEVKRVKISRRNRSAWIGLGIGGFAGDAIGAASVAHDHDNLTTLAAETGGLLIGCIVGAVVGVVTDFTRSTIYRAP
jgi:hypothetical protein